MNSYIHLVNAKVHCFNMDQIFKDAELDITVKIARFYEELANLSKDLELAVVNLPREKKA